MTTDDDRPKFSASGGPPLQWADGLCRVHCREDRCCFGCSCPGHNEDGTHTPQGPSIDELRAAVVGPPAPPGELDELNRALLDIVATLGAIVQRVGEIDENTLSRFDQIVNLIRGHTDWLNALSDRVGMLELDRKGGQR